MSKSVLRHTLLVRHPDTSEPAVLAAGSEVPDWATDLVQPDDLEGTSKAPAKKQASSKSEK